MTSYINIILQSLKNSNYLKGNCVVLNEKIRCDSSLLENGFKLRELLLEQLLNKSINWSTQCGGIRKNDESIIKNNMESSAIQRIEFQKSYENKFNENLIEMSNSVAFKVMCCNGDRQFLSKNNLFYGGKTKSVLLVNDYFVAAENDLFRYNNLQREHKVWWMKFSANPSRYWVKPCELTNRNDPDDIYKKSKSMSIKAKYAYGSVEMENIFLVPLHEFADYTDHFRKISLIRSVINLDLAASALILDSTILRSGNKNLSLMLNRKLAPYQVLLVNLHDQSKTVGELTTHLQNVIRRSGLRLFNSPLYANFQIELEKKFLKSDSLGIPYVLVIDNESTKSGLIKMRSRDTTLFETIHISDIPNYLVNTLKH